METPAGMPPVIKADQQFITHAELTITGGHVLMATDVPESTGLKVTHCNNMHINLEPGPSRRSQAAIGGLI